MTVRVAVCVVPFVPEIVTFVVFVTGWVVTVNVAVVVPAGTVTLAGTVATEVKLLDKVTTVPPLGAGPDIATVPVDGVFPLTVVGLRASELNVGVVTVSVAVRATPSVAVIVTEALEATGLVVMVKEAVVAFAGTVTLVGTRAAAVLLLERVTTAPPDGAGPLRVTVPVEEVPPITEVGLTVTALAVAAVTVSVAVFAVR